MNKLPRFSLRWFLAGVAYLAFGCAAVRQPDGLTAILFQTLSWAIIFASVVAAMLGHRAARGFAIVSLVYAVVGVCGLGSYFGPHQLTEWLAAFAQAESAPYIPPEYVTPGYTPQDLGNGRIQVGPTNFYFPKTTDRDQKRRTVHLAVAIMWGLAGAWFASVVSNQGANQASQSALM